MTDAFIMSHPKSFLKIKREYLVVVIRNRYLRVYDFVDLRQVWEVDFGVR